MKILIITRNFAYMPGGISDHVYFLGKNLSKSGNQIVVLTSKTDKIKRDPEIKTFPLIERWSFSSFIIINKILRKEKPDCVNFHFQPYMYSYYGIPFYVLILIGLIRVLGVPVVTTFHEVAIRLNPKRPKYWGIGISQRIIGFILGGISNKLIFNNNYYKKLVLGFNRKKYFIPNGSNLPFIELSEKTKKRIREIIAPKGEKIITIFGGGASWRGNEILMKGVLNFSLENGVPVKLAVLGTQGVDNIKNETSLMELVEKYKMEKMVFVPGYLEEEKVFGYLSVSDLFILFDVGGYGGVCIKSTSLAAAYSASIPVLGNKGILTDDNFTENKNIIFVKAVEELEITKSLVKFFENKNLQEQLRKGSKETFEKVYRWEDIVKKYNSIFSSLILN